MELARNLSEERCSVGTTVVNEGLVSSTVEVEELLDLTKLNLAFDLVVALIEDVLADSSVVEEILAVRVLRSVQAKVLILTGERSNAKVSLLWMEIAR
jgi:hypothetical protein